MFIQIQRSSKLLRYQQNVFNDTIVTRVVRCCSQKPFVIFSVANVSKNKMVRKKDYSMNIFFLSAN